jgi:hypothetical protein
MSSPTSARRSVLQQRGGVVEPLILGLTLSDGSSTTGQPSRVSTIQSQRISTASSAGLHAVAGLDGEDGTRVRTGCVCA